MKSVLFDALPTLIVGLPPHEDLAVVATGGEDVAELWVSPSDLPNGTFMAGQSVEQLLLSGGRAGGSSSRLSTGS